jgi:hypothetical protein
LPAVSVDDERDHGGMAGLVGVEVIERPPTQGAAQRLDGILVADDYEMAWARPSRPPVCNRGCSTFGHATELLGGEGEI